MFGDTSYIGDEFYDKVTLFSRPTKKYPTTQQQINTAPREILEESLNYHNQLLFEKERERTVDATILKDWEVTELDRAVTNTSAIINKTKQRLKELDDGIQPPLFSRAATETQPPYMDFNRQQIRDFSSNRGFW